jgi:hypothetical protein
MKRLLLIGLLFVCAACFRHEYDRPEKLRIQSQPIMYCVGALDCRIPLAKDEVKDLEDILAGASDCMKEKALGGCSASIDPNQYYYISIGKGVFDALCFDQNIRLLNDCGLDQASRRKLERLARAIIHRGYRTTTNPRANQ